MNNFPIKAYLVLGSVGSGRIGTVYDILENGFLETDFTAVFVSKNEPSKEYAAKISDSALGGLVLYSNTEDVVKILEGKDAQKFTNVIYVSDSTVELASQIEFFKTLCDRGFVRLVRIWGFVDCALFNAEKDKAAPYFDAVAHFSDCLFLANRENLSQKQMHDILDKYEKAFHPHLYVNVKKGCKVDNAMQLTIDEARRISVYFDDYDAIDDLDLDEDNLPEEPFDITKKPDIYLERAENGMLLKPLPDMIKLREKFENQKQ